MASGSRCIGPWCPKCAETSAEIARMPRPDAPHPTAVVDVGWTPDEKQVAAIDIEGHLVLWDPFRAGDAGAGYPGDFDEE